VYRYRWLGGCRGVRPAFSRARPIGESRPALGGLWDGEAVNVVGPVLYGGLFLSYALFVVAILYIDAGLAVKVASLTLLSLLAGWLWVAMGAPPGGVRAAKAANDVADAETEESQAPDAADEADAGPGEEGTADSGEEEEGDSPAGTEEPEEA